jgi:signal transduction histidine kinase
VFTVSMAAVLLVAGLFVYAAMRTVLTGRIDDALETQIAAMARVIVEHGGVDPNMSEGLDDPGESFTQVIGPGEHLLSSTPGLPLRPLLDPQQRREAAEGMTITLEGLTLVPDEEEDADEVDFAALQETGSRPFEEPRSRVLARRLDLGEEQLSIVAGQTFEERNAALGELTNVLLVGAPLALLMAALVGYGAIRTALRPVESMRSRAAVISAARAGERLPAPAGDDELARLGRTLNEMLARLERALERERAFAADASHELRTPLAILRGELELALRGRHAPEELETTLRSALEETERVTSITEALLLLARSDNGRLELRREPIDVEELLEGARHRFSRRIEQEGRSVQVSCPPGLVVLADRARLDQALSNLIENALRHGAGDVELGARYDGEGAVTLTVADRGPGIPPEFLPYAFERFTRADSGRTGTGTGLGLAIAAMIATAHGGSVELRSREGGGTEALLLLPAAAEAFTGRSAGVA